MTLVKRRLSSNGMWHVISGRSARVIATKHGLRDSRRPLSRWLTSNKLLHFVYACPFPLKTARVVLVETERSGGF